MLDRDDAPADVDAVLASHLRELDEQADEYLPLKANPPGGSWDDEPTRVMP